MDGSTDSKVGVTAGLNANEMGMPQLHVTHMREFSYYQNYLLSTTYTVYKWRGDGGQQLGD